MEFQSGRRVRALEKKPHSLVQQALVGLPCSPSSCSLQLAVLFDLPNLPASGLRVSAAA